MSNPEVGAWIEPLSQRESEILRLISEGYSNREIAHKLFLSIETVKWYNKQLFSKLGVSSRTQAAAAAREHKLLDPATLQNSVDTLPPHNLPLQLSSFLGREQEIAEVVRLLTPTVRPSSTDLKTSARLITLTGAGGVGKTRLALEAAAKMLGDFPDGIWLVDFAPIADPTRVPHTVNAVLGLREAGSKPVLVHLITHLQAKTALFLFDNCEHLIGACAELAAAILQACPNVSILATSREALGVAGETSFLVNPLSIPHPNLPLSVETLGEYDAVRLFVERARAALPDFSLTAAYLPAVVKICRRLDGLPLAIELAAARVKALAVTDIALRLEESFHLLIRGSRTALPRAQTLQACMEWSYALLSEVESLLLNRLGVFSGGWSLEAAEHICAGGFIEPSEVVNLLAQLVDKSLVVVDRRPSAGLRYRFLETTRQFALEKLNASGETAALRGKHLEYFLQMIEKGRPDRNERDQIEWLNRVETDYDNLHAALEWSLADEVDSAFSIRLAIRLGEYWDWRGFFDEGRHLLSAVLARLEDTAPTLEHAELLYQNAWLAIYQSDVPAGVSLLEESRMIFSKFHPQGLRGEVDVLNSLAAVEIDSGDSRIAVDHAQRALEIASEIDYPIGITHAHHMLGVALGHIGDFEGAWKHLETSLAMNPSVGRSSISVLHNLGELAVRQGDFEKAKPFLDESIRSAEEAKDKWNLGAALGTLSWAALRQGDFAQARRHLGESLKVRQDIGDKGGTAWCLEKLAEMAMLQGVPEKGARLLGIAANIRLEANSPVNSADKPDYDRLLASLREYLGQEKFQESWQAGSGMALDSAIQLALDLDLPPLSP
jgi:predicted ATPase/DNA-binding CsgD family transcriptional regulator/Flp pilus assembly protein TadD